MKSQPSSSRVWQASITASTAGTFDEVGSACEVLGAAGRRDDEVEGRGMGIGLVPEPDAGTVASLTVRECRRRLDPVWPPSLTSVRGTSSAGELLGFSPWSVALRRWIMVSGVRAVKAETQRAEHTFAAREALALDVDPAVSSPSVRLTPSADAWSVVLRCESEQ